MNRSAVVALVTLIASTALFSEGSFAIDQVCKMHAVDPVIDAKARDLALELLAGDTEFIKHWNAELLSLRAGPDAGAKETELAVDMHCKAVQDFDLTLTADLRLTTYSVDFWRVDVNQSIAALDSTKDVPATLVEVNELIKRVQEKSWDIFIADFNRNAAKYGQARFSAVRKPGGGILIKAQ